MILIFCALLLTPFSSPQASHDPCIDLIEAAFLDEAEEMADLFADGVSANCQDHDGETPLMLAAEGGSVAAIRILLAHGAEVNVWDRNGQSALDRARSKISLFHMKGAERYHLIYTGIVDLLVSLGARDRAPPKPPRKPGKKKSI